MRFVLALLINYLRLIVFALAVVVGAQVPGFVAQYQTVVRAHMNEALLALQGFEQTASRYFQGDMQKLIAYYRQSQDQVFMNDANNIQALVDRVERLKAENEALQTHSLQSAWHVLQNAQSPLFKESYQHYNWVIPIQLNTVFWGFAIAVFLSLMLDSFWFCCQKAYQSYASKRPVGKAAS